MMIGLNLFQNPVAENRGKENKGKGGGKEEEVRSEGNEADK